MKMLLLILILLLVVLVVAGLYVMFKKDEPKAGTMSQSQLAATLVNVRNVRTPSGATAKAVTLIINEDTTVPYNVALEGGWEEEETDLEIFRDPSRPMEERRAAAQRLRDVGYQIREEFFMEGDAAVESPAASGGNEDDGETSGPDIESETDIAYLESFLSNPYIGADERARIESRIAELRGSGVAGEDGERDEEDNGGDAGDDGSSYGGGFVDPLDMMTPLNPQPESVYEPAGREEKEAEPAPAPQPAREEVKEERQAPVDTTLTDRKGYYRGEVDGEDVITMDFTEEYDDEEDSRKAVRLMKFIARSFKERLLSPELVMFAQRRLHLEVNPGYWSDEDYARANARVGVYERNPAFVNMSQEEFDMYYHDVVSSAEDRRAAEEAAAASAKEIARSVAEEEEARVSGPVPEPVPEPAAEAAEDSAGEPEGDGGGAAAPEPKAVRKAAPPKKERTRPSSKYFDSVGGRNDLMWSRLEK